jgi:hypothetical protein
MGATADGHFVSSNAGFSMGTKTTSKTSPRNTCIKIVSQLTTFQEGITTPARRLSVEGHALMRLFDYSWLLDEEALFCK